jgi:hypothetical protein
MTEKRETRGNEADAEEGWILMGIWLRKLDSYFTRIQERENRSENFFDLKTLKEKLFLIEIFSLVNFQSKSFF